MDVTEERIRSHKLRSCSTFHSTCRHQGRTFLNVHYTQNC